jgi:maltose O-acetyltransferase
MQEVGPGTEKHVVRRIKRETAAMYSAWLPRLRLANLLCRLAPPLSLATVRATIYRGIGFDIGDQVSFLGSMTVIGAGHEIYSRLSIGKGSIIGLNTTFNLDAKISIGRNVSIGPSVSIFTSTHMLGPASRRMQLEVIAKPVVVEDGAWVGAGCIILPGVVIGRGCVVSAGSVVKANVPPNIMVAGNPAVSIHTLPLQDR